MKRKLLYSFVAFALLVAASQREAFAQDDEGPDVKEHPFEVGAQLTFIGLNFPEVVSTSPAGVFTSSERGVTTAGYGARFAYNVSRHVALEAEVNHLPQRNINEVFQNRRTQVFAGVRAGRRWETVGVFAKVRPGAMNFDEYGTRGPCTVTFPASGPLGCFGEARTFFAADVGGVVEFYPSSRTIFRIDAGDTIIRFREVGPITFPPIGTSPGSSQFTRADTTHNFQMTFGFGFRF
ncbi:MAG TPA: hypothetical protein VK421_07375 [Pyrinomonadaceae bacterium]|nr:hypothetical protein [Pyrinomonadaceae bacterium]